MEDGKWKMGNGRWEMEDGKALRGRRPCRSFSIFHLPFSILKGAAGFSPLTVKRLSG
jgi:hypothetical protein